jgi:hypothetical protein
MAKVAGIAASTVQAVWKAHGLSPHRWRQFKLSNDPAFAEKLTLKMLGVENFALIHFAIRNPTAHSAGAKRLGKALSTDSRAEPASSTWALLQARSGSVGALFRHRAAAQAAEALHHHEEHRGEQQGHDRGRDHAADHRGADRLA